jgi:acetyl-CoA carboxylase biotin carboxyl carrier protein
VSLTAADVAEILRLVEASSFDELSLEFEGLKLKFKRGETTLAPESAAAPAVPHIAPPCDSRPVEVAAPAADPNTQTVLAPMLGTFYRASKPGAPPFVTVGSTVAEDTIVGIIEVMKLMNTVRANVRGTVTDILARDGALVEYGEVLLRVAKTS